MTDANQTCLEFPREEPETEFQVLLVPLGSSSRKIIEEVRNETEEEKANTKHCG